MVDDFIPPAGQHDAAKYDANAGKLIRGAGNIAGRGRADTTGKARAAKPPRGQMLTTGEDIPTGHSVRARLFIVEWVKSDVDVAKLTAAQEAGQSGHYAAAMAGYVRWLAKDYPARKTAFDADTKRRREAMHALYPHGRTATTAAALLAAWGVFLRFAEESRAIDAKAAAALAARADAAVREVASLQSDHQTAADPVARFQELLSAALASGRAHVATVTGSAPQNDPGAWGWRRLGTVWEPQGSRVGWLDGDALYLEPDASYAAAQVLAASSGGGLGMQPTTLHKRMHEKGLILTTDTGRLKIQRTIEGRKNKRVLHVSATLGLLLSLESGESGESGGDEEKSLK